MVNLYLEPTMNNLLIYQAKPNPSGKDRSGYLTPTAQLAGEWIDIQNATISGVDLSVVELYHRAYTTAHPEGEWEKVFNMAWVLPAGDTLRIHSGGKIPLEDMHHQDQFGAEWHAFTGKNYIWNNSRPDTPLLFNRISKLTVDKATYYSNPQEGKILRRRGDLLV